MPCDGKMISRQAEVEFNSAFLLSLFEDEDAAGRQPLHRLICNGKPIDLNYWNVGGSWKDRWIPRKYEKMMYYSKWSTLSREDEMKMNRTGSMESTSYFCAESVDSHHDDNGVTTFTRMEDHHNVWLRTKSCLKLSKSKKRLHLWPLQLVTQAILFSWKIGTPKTLDCRRLKYLPAERAQLLANNSTKQLWAYEGFNSWMFMVLTDSLQMTL